MDEFLQVATILFVLIGIPLMLILRFWSSIGWLIKTVYASKCFFATYCAFLVFLLMSYGTINHKCVVEIGQDQYSTFKMSNNVQASIDEVNLRLSGRYSDDVGIKAK